MTIEIVMADKPNKLDIMQPWFKVVAQFDTAEEYQEWSGNSPGEEDYEYDPNDPPLDRVVMIINDGDGGEQIATVRVSDMTMDIKNSEGVNFCEFDPYFYLDAMDKFTDFIYGLTEGGMGVDFENEKSPDEPG